ncbi:Procollagen galactosyltransferase 1 [Geodia barretti]|uniref:Procollagen galactosyltransferase 1 n=1 Tax=Geodia barretti TaxID=519541 RepID=A0AA35R8P3_GEOBA|nr:Procollagen galactosyltransferase 1 [Geodia barretti]
MTISAESAEKFYAAAYGLSPHVFVSVLVTNSLHALPNFLGYLEGLDYPKDRISLWFRTDHNVDGTAFALKHWCRRVRELYKSVDCHASYTWTYPTRDPYSTSVHRYKNKARLRQQALEAALTAGADYLLSLDVDCFLLNPKTLHTLMAQEKTIVAPMLDPPKSSTGSNFWMAMDEMGQYATDDLYMGIVQRKRVGCFQCPLVYGAVLVHLASPYAENLVYHPPHPRFIGRVDDVTQFAFSAQNEGVGMYILNTEFFGFIMPNKKYTNINKASEDFFQFKINTLATHPPLIYSKYAKRQRPILRNAALGLDAIYVVNLARRPERRARMTTLLDEMGYNYTIFNAIDGRNLNDSYLEDELGIRYLDIELDEFEANNKKMRKGQVGCFLSHYTIWKKMLEEKQETILVMEDDVKFKTFFSRGLSEIIMDAKRNVPDWDHIYLGRVKVDRRAIEPHVPGTQWLVKPAHSFLMLCYLLSRRGAEKLIAADPLSKLLPTDEFISLMRGTPAKRGKKWALHYPLRNLNSYSAHPTLVSPTHFYGHKDHVTDTAPPEEMGKLLEKHKKSKEIKIDDGVREGIKQKALQRQIQKFKNMAVRDEL